MKLYEGTVTWIIFSIWLPLVVSLFFHPTTWMGRLRHTMLGDAIELLRPQSQATFLMVLLGALCQERPASLEQVLKFYFSFVICWYGAIYTINGMADRREDAQHPTKKIRPFAAGRRSLTFGVIYSLLLLGTGLYTARLWLPPRIVDGYVGVLCVNLAYTYVFRNVRYLHLIVNVIPHAMRGWLGFTLAGVEPDAATMALFFFLALSELATLVMYDTMARRPQIYRGSKPNEYNWIARISIVVFVLITVLTWHDNVFLRAHFVLIGLLGLYARVGTLLAALPIGVLWMGTCWLALREGQMLGNDYWVSESIVCVIVYFAFVPLAYLLRRMVMRSTPSTAESAVQG